MSSTGLAAGASGVGGSRVAWLVCVVLVGCGSSRPRDVRDADAPVDAGPTRDGNAPSPDARADEDATTADAGLPDADDGVTLAVGLSHSCAVRADGAVDCWGANDRGQLGDGTTTSRPTRAPVLDLVDAVEVSAGISHSCARVADGTVRCWGYDDEGQLGDGDASTEPRTRAVEVSGVSDVIQVAVGSWHSCALIADHTVRCWGRNASSELGDGTTTRRTTAVEVVGLRGVEEVTAGTNFTCARMTDGTARCWGEELAMVNPDGTVPTRPTPVAVEGLSGVTQIEAGYDHVCALMEDSGVRCWGWNTNGALGDGTNAHRLEPTPVVGLEGPVRDVVEIAAGWYTCARLVSGAVLCSGEVYYARPVAGIEDAVEIDVGSHACARRADGSFRCWGYNADGQAMAGGCCHDSLCGIPDGASCGRDGGTCEALWCSACGDEGEPCCDRARVGGRRCREERSLCDGSETCVACGVLGEPCCEGESPCDAEGAVCFRGVCAQPGRPGAPCAEGGACDAAGCCVLEGHSDHVCVSVGSECTVPEGATARLCGAGGSCSGCGGDGEPCCASASSRIESYCSAPGLACNAESTCSVE